METRDRQLAARVRRGIPALRLALTLGALSACHRDEEEVEDTGIHCPYDVGGRSLRHAEARIYGRRGDWHVGEEVAAAGDVNGDGLDDFLVHGEPYVYLWYGPVSGEREIDEADAQFWSLTFPDVAGEADLDGDGYGDLGLCYYDVHDTEGRSGAYIVYGPVTQDGHVSLIENRIYSSDGDFFTSSEIAIFGTEGSDSGIILGSPGDDSFGRAGGAAGVFYGAPTSSTSLEDIDAVLMAEEEGDAAGSEVATGDMNADGVTDFIISARLAEDRGVVYVVYGPVSGVWGLEAADARLSGEEDGYAGAIIEEAGDTNGDGHADLLVQDPGFIKWTSTYGVGYLVQGPVSGERELSASDAFLIDEGSVSGLGSAGDVDGDGLWDVLVGDMVLETCSEDEGGAYLLFGPLSGALGVVDADVTFAGEFWDNYAGEAVSGAGDVDGDGLADLLISAPNWWNEQGAAYLVTGASLQ